MSPSIGHQILTRRHLLVGWVGLLIFLSLGVTLEALHGLKSAYYLDTRNVTRRLMWTLAHTHGTLFSVVNIVFALTLDRMDQTRQVTLRLSSYGLMGGLIFLPLGFFLGGVSFYGGDPGLGIFLVPVGAALMLLGVGTFVRGLIKFHAGHSRGVAPQGGNPQIAQAGGGKSAAGPTATGRGRDRNR